MVYPIATRRTGKGVWDHDWAVEEIRETEWRDGNPWFSVKYVNVAYKQEFRDGEFVSPDLIFEYSSQTTLTAASGFKPTEAVAQNLRLVVEWARKKIPGFNLKIDLPLLDTEDTTQNGIPLNN
jgi:hypothetical protein